MSKGLELFQELRKSLNEILIVSNVANDKLDTIEQELKEYDLMKQIKIIVVDKKISDEDLKRLINQKVFADNLEQCEIKPLLDEETKKKLKALEIIRKHIKINAYRIFADGYENELTQEEYDLLKEVLL